MNKIVAIVGMSGSGKSIASEYFKSLSFNEIYFGGITIDKLKDARLEITPKNEKMIREKLREDYGMGAFAILLLPKIEEYLEKSNVVLDGLYSWDEYKILKEKFGEQLIVIAIVCDKEKRYQRIGNRIIRSLTNEQIKDRDISEIENLAKGGPIVFADYFILNNGSMEDYQKELKKLAIKVLEEVL